MPEEFMKLVREMSNQSSADLNYLSKIDSYWDNSYGTPCEKLEAFTKYVSRQSLTKFLARTEIFNLQKNIHGSIVEVGVHRGASLMTWAQLSTIFEPINYTRKVIGFDTFRGFVEVDPKDSKGDSEHLKTGGFATEECCHEELLQAFDIFDSNRLMNHIPKCEVVVGDVSETLPAYLEENPHLIVSLLHLDADLYKPTKAALELLLPRMPKGSVILFDEVNMRLFPGETIALLESLSIRDHALRRFTYATSMSYVLIG